MRTTISLDDDVYRAAEQMARASGQRIGQVLSELARRGLRSMVAELPAGQRFPVFDVPPDAPVVTAASLERFTQG